MHYEEERGGAGRRLRFILLLIGLFILAAAVGFVAMGGLKGLPFLKKAPDAYYAEGPISALRLTAPGDADEDALRAYYGEAIAFARENGFNTLLFEAKQGATVLWRDGYFPPVAGAAAQDTWRHKSDPLAILCEALVGQELQLWLEVDPYTGGAVPTEPKNRLAELVAESGISSEAFLPGDQNYANLLAESIGALPKKYPISGIIFTGLDDGWARQDTEAFTEMLKNLHTNLAATGKLPPLGLAFDAKAQNVNAAYAKGLKTEGLLTWALARVEPGEAAAAQLDTLALLGDGLVLSEPVDDDGLTLFYARSNPALSGVLYGSWPEAAGKAGQFAYLSASLTTTDAPLPEGFEVPALLAVNYPDQNAKLYTDQTFIMGNSDPTQPLLLDGAEVPAENRAAGGSFGIAVDLARGDNSFTFTQGDKEVTLKVQKPAPTGGGTAPTYPQDHTKEAPEGQAIRVVSQIASALTDPGDLSAINETLPAGAVFIADGSVQTRRWNSAAGRTDTTWAYRLKSGDYVHAVNCEWVDQGTAQFAGITATPDPEKRGEWLDFGTGGSPAAYIHYDDAAATLALTFYNTTIQLPEGFSSTLVQRAEVAPGEKGATVLTLYTTGLWGYNIEYAGGGTQLFLKGTPTLSGDAAKPLAGIRVMLDPGHGDTDRGAPGVMGTAGPNEKEMNLAQAQAIAYRLQQLGATVLMTRTGDEFYELEERLAMQNEQKPDFFLSVHHNSVELDRDRTGAKGVEAYYYHPYSRPPSKTFAQNLVERISAETGRTLRKDAEWTYFYVTRSTVCPSVLFEYGFVVSPTEFEDIMSQKGLYAAAFATVDALMATIPQ